MIKLVLDLFKIIAWKDSSFFLGAVELQLLLNINSLILIEVILISGQYLCLLVKIIRNYCPVFQNWELVLCYLFSYVVIVWIRLTSPMTIFQRILLSLILFFWILMKNLLFTYILYLYWKFINLHPTRVPHRITVNLWFW